MDLNTVSAVLQPRSREALPAWREGDAFLAGGSWLFSEPQPGLGRLVDLPSLGWTPCTVDGTGLTLAATCTIAALNRLACPPDWRAAPLIGQCCRALLGSFKVWNVATIGGNICLALPAGPMTSLAAALSGTGLIWMPDGGERRLPVIDLVTGPRTNALRPGEILRSVTLPADALARRTAFRRISLSPNGRSAALVIGTVDVEGGLDVTVTASTPRPVRVALPPGGSAADLAERLAAAIPPDGWYDDVHGAPDWRRHVTGLLAEEIRRELAAPAGGASR